MRFVAVDAIALHQVVKRSLYSQYRGRPSIADLMSLLLREDAWIQYISISKALVTCFLRVTGHALMGDRALGSYRIEYRPGQYIISNEM